MTIKEDDIVTAVAVSTHRGKLLLLGRRRHSGSQGQTYRHSVPEGVAVEELKSFNGKKDLKNDCPGTPHLQGCLCNLWFLQAPVGRRDPPLDRVHGCLAVGFQFRPAINTPFPIGRERSSRPIYSTELRFPNGVVVEELKSGKNRKVLQESIPTLVHERMDPYGWMAAYKKLVEDCVASGGASKDDARSWKTASVQALIEEHQKVFRETNMDLDVGKTKESIRHGQSGGHSEYFRWIEFVDRSRQPNDVAQRDADAQGGTDDGCLVM